MKPNKIHKQLTADNATVRNSNFNKEHYYTTKSPDKEIYNQNK